MVVWRPWVSGWLCGVVGGVVPVVWCCWLLLGLGFLVGFGWFTVVL